MVLMPHQSSLHVMYWVCGLFLCGLRHSVPWEYAVNGRFAGVFLGSDWQLVGKFHLGHLVRLVPQYPGCQKAGGWGLLWSHALHGEAKQRYYSIDALEKCAVARKTTIHNQLQHHSVREWSSQWGHKRLQGVGFRHPRYYFWVSGFFVVWFFLDSLSVFGFENPT